MSTVNAWLVKRMSVRAKVREASSKRGWYILTHFRGFPR